MQVIFTNYYFIFNKLFSYSVKTQSTRLFGRESIIILFMENILKESGERLKEVRLVFNQGKKLSSEQFAYSLDETGDRIKNYEYGKASIPIRLLYRLYKKGINPNFIISGEGGMFAQNYEGLYLKNSIFEKATRNGEEKLLKLVADSDRQKSAT